jgi:hypothetical protein
MRRPVDRNGKLVHAGSRVRLLSLSGEWFESLPLEEKADVESMIGEVFEVEEIDEYGQPWICACSVMRRSARRDRQRLKRPGQSAFRDRPPVGGVGEPT